MPRYKKKKHNRILSSPKKRTKTPVKSKALNSDIPMTPHKEVKNKAKSEHSLKVVAGKKGERLRKFKVFSAGAAIVLGLLLIFQIVLPAGIFQTLSNLTAVLGTGSYPISVSGSETLSVVPFNNYYFHLTDITFSGYSASGKVLFSEPHGFERAVLATSSGRALLYNQGGNQFAIYDLNGERSLLTTEKEIICGAISDSGNYAVVTYSDSYASAVSVYNKRNKLIYEWYSAEETVNNVAISSNGKKIAVSTFNSASGVFNSKVNVINFKSATPEYSEAYNGQLIYGVKSSNKSRFCVIKSNGIDFIKWSNHKIEKFSDDYNVSLFKNNASVITAVLRRDSDKTDNRIVILSKNGKVKENIRYKGVLNDVQVRGSNIYCISDTAVSVLDFEGNVKFTADYGFGGEGICVTSANVAAVITDSEIKRIKLTKGTD